MSTRQRLLAASLASRPLSPRCRGGASSLLRLGQGATAQRAEVDRLAGWLGRPAATAGIEHIVGRRVEASLAC